MTDAEVAELKKLVEKATPGPWTWWTSNSMRRLRRDDHGISQKVLEPYVCTDGVADCSISDDDMAFIAAARTALPRLIEERERLQMAIKEARPFLNAQGQRILDAALSCEQKEEQP